MKRAVWMLAAAATGFAQVRAPVPASETGRPGQRGKLESAGRGARGGAEPQEKAAGASPRDLKFPPLHSVQPPKLITATLPNGLRLYLAEQRDLPIIGGVVMVRTGEVVDPPDRIGLATLAGDLLRSGGTEVKTGDQVEETLNSLGMTLDSSMLESAGMITFSALERNAGDSLAFLREILVQPEFRQDRLERAKARLRHSIAHRNDDIPALMRHQMASLIFGKNSPYGWQPGYPDIARITHTDLKTFHKRYFFPRNLMLGVWGDFDAARMQSTLGRLFGDWTAGQQPVPEFPKATATPAAGIYLGEKKDVPVTHIMLGQASGTVTQKDYSALEVMGLMFNQVQARISKRAREPLTAGNMNLLGVSIEDVKATWSAGFDRPGIFRIYGTCRGAATPEVLRALYADVEQMRTVEVSEDELRKAKDQALDALATGWDTTAKAFAQVMTQEYHGLPRGFAQEYQAGIAAVTRADVLRVARQYLNPATMTTLVIGDPQVFSTPLDKVNPNVNRIDLTIPEPKQVIAESSDASIAEGKRVLQRAQAAVGGADKLAAVKDYVILTEYQLDPAVPDIGGVKVPQTDRWISPEIYRQDLSLPTGSISAYLDGKAGWITARQGWGMLAGVQLKQLEGDLFRCYFRVLLSDTIEGRTVNLVDRDLVEITDTSGQIVRIEFDPQSGLPRRATYDVPQTSGAPMFTEDVYSDFRDLGGVKYPFKTVITQSGRKFADVLVTDARVNTGIRQIELALRPQ